MKKFNISLQNSLLSLSLLKRKSKVKAFTLAEILLSLTIIGIVAAIALPSLLGNANERAWETQKKALYTRFSQSLPLLPSLNGYGELEGTLSSNSADGKQHVDIDTAAESFVRDGLSKVMKITNICDNKHLSDCGLPDKIIPINGGSAIETSNIKTLGLLNAYMINSVTFEQLNTKAAAFETTNGESILVYYTPNCEPNMESEEWQWTLPKLCANFVYDLNGKKGPNTVGKDIAFITALYATDPVVVAPNPYPNDSPDSIAQTDAAAKCIELDTDAKVPTIDELASMFYNQMLLGMQPYISYWSSTTKSADTAYRQAFVGRHGYDPKNSKFKLRCVKR